MAQNGTSAGTSSPRFLFSAENRAKLMAQAVGTAEGRETVTVGGVTFPVYPLSFAQGLEVFKYVKQLGALWSKFRSKDASTTAEKEVGEMIEECGPSIQFLVMKYIAYCCGLGMKYTVPTRDLDRVEVARRLGIGGAFLEMEIDDENEPTFRDWFFSLPLIPVLVELGPPLLRVNGMGQIVSPTKPAEETPAPLEENALPADTTL